MASLLFVSPLVLAGGGSLGLPVSITNSNFEAGSLTGWSSTVSSWVTGITGSSTADNTTSSSGIFSAKIVLNNAGPGALGYSQLTQSVSLSTNTYYQFSVDVKTDAEKYVFLDLQGSDGSLKRLVNVTSTPASEWKSLKFNFKTPASVLTWTINLRLNGIPAGTSANLWVDNVTLTSISILDKSEFTVGAIGDSQVSHLGTFAAQENDIVNSWLSSSIRKAHQDTLIVNPPLNKGVAGNNSSQVAARVQADIVEASPKPEITYVAVGTNDAAASINVETFKNNIITILQILKAGGVKPVLFLITPRTDAVNIDPYNTAITEAAIEESVTLFDPTTALTSNPSWESEWMDDSVHYNYLGHIAIGKELGVFLKDFVEGPLNLSLSLQNGTCVANNGSTPQFVFSASDNVAVDHYTVTIDSSTTTTQTSPYQLPMLSYSEHTLQVTAFDALWNSSQSDTLILPKCVYALENEEGNVTSGFTSSRILPASTSGSLQLGDEESDDQVEVSVDNSFGFREQSILKEQTYNLVIVVKDSRGNPLEGAEVILHSREQKGFTDGAGIVEFSNVEKGVHKVVVTYEDHMFDRDFILDGEEETHDMTLILEEEPTQVNLPIIVGVVFATLISIGAFAILRKR